uniref:Uncharacterized protein n=1 Tax=Panagrellus redivivus TaxID=6233 RepID=A0A7E4WD01_PANRE
MSAPGSDSNSAPFIKPEDAERFEEMRVKFRAIFAGQREKLAALKKQFAMLEEKCDEMQANAAGHMREMDKTKMERHEKNDRLALIKKQIREYRRQISQMKRANRMLRKRVANLLRNPTIAAALVATLVANHQQTP